MNEIIGVIKPYFELASYLSTSILIITVIFGAQQIKLLKKDIEIRDKRLAVEKSIEYMDRFANKVLPNFYKYEAMIKSGNLKKYSGVISAEFILDKNYIYDETDMAKKGETGCFDLVNELEIFAVVILNGLADEEVAFNPLCRVYCNAVEVLYDVICTCRDGGKGELFINAITLYKKWSLKL